MSAVKEMMAEAKADRDRASNRDEIIRQKLEEAGVIKPEGNNDPVPLNDPNTDVDTGSPDTGEATPQTHEFEELVVDEQKSYNDYNFDELTGKIKDRTPPDEAVEDEEPVAAAQEPDNTPPAVDPKEKEIEEMKSELTFYREQHKLLQEDPEGFVKEVLPSFFEKPIDVQKILDDEFGKDFLAAEYDQDEARKVGTRSNDYDLRRFELQLQLKNQKKGREAKEILSAREKVYREGVPFLNEVINKLKKEYGKTDADIEAMVKRYSDEGYGRNPIKSFAYGLLKEVESENILLKEKKSLEAENKLLKSKRAVPAAPTNETGKLTTKPKKVDLGEWEGLRPSR